jgi:hypothetical protein
VLKPWQFEGATCWGIETEFYFPDDHRVTEENKRVKALMQKVYMANRMSDLRATLFSSRNLGRNKS